jgi:hypothetical protein
MSVNSATDTFTTGPELFDQEKYWSTVSTSIEPDPKAMDEVFNKVPLADRISVLHSNRNSVYGEFRVDDVKVRCPSDAFRKHQKEQWHAEKTEAEKKHTWWVWTAIGSGVTAAAGAIGMVVEKPVLASYLGKTIADSPAAPLLLAAGAVTALVSLIFMSIESTAIAKAHEQINKWDASPAMKIGRERDYAHSQGFPYIYAHNLKLGKEGSYTGRFHPKQVEHDYKTYFRRFCETLLDPNSNANKVTWMNSFSSSNPLARALMTYGLGHVPDRMKPVLEDYTRFEDFLKNIRQTYETLITQVRTTAKGRIDDYIKTRNELLQPYAQARDTAIATAKGTRDRVLREHPLETDRRNREARANFNAIKEALEGDYTRGTNPINKKYNDKIKEVETSRDRDVSKLEGQKSQQVGNNYNAAHELLARAKQAWDGQEYQAVNFQQYFAYQQPAQPVWYGQPQPAQPVYYQQPAQPAPVYYQQPAQVPPAPVYYQQPAAPAPVYYQQPQPAAVQPQPGSVSYQAYPQYANYGQAPVQPVYYYAAATAG